ncbi:hypothetical protein [Mucilaginibacter sp.]|uniref:hypothetical protein n=1 Tax=Mucilaginibacter sp. TaxID=1882438 RepID=UPI0026269DFE|nr:hypothetical protein [Mucilaginibacter sp.]MDB5031517.1 hypothetical protein [Mucilaginibacter sp.]
MDDQLDNDLTNRIREVFDNFEDAHADEGWLLLREKFPEKEKRRPVAWLWWSSAAALLLLFLGILLFKQTPVNKQNLVSVKKEHPDNPAEKTIERKKDHSIKDSLKTDSVINSLQHQNLADHALRPELSDKAAPYRSNRQLPIPSASNQQAGITGDNIAKNGITAKESAVTDHKKTYEQNNAAKADGGITVDTGINQTVKSLAGIVPPRGINMQEQVKKSNKTLFADNDVPGNKKSEKSKNTDKAVRFSLYAATYFNYAKGSSNQLNVGAGVTSDIKLNRNLNLSTGLAIAQNTLSYGNQAPTATAQINSLAAVSSLAVPKQNILYAAAVPSLKNYNASLVGLDVPLNLKYEFNPEKSAAYVSIGLSSGTFINETYTYRYNNYSVPFSTNTSQIPDQSTHQSFNSFYFAKTLNFSFGTGYSLGRNKLIIEPFLKYPLEGLGSQQIKFGAGGLNLKFNFQTKKK